MRPREAGLANAISGPSQIDLFVLDNVAKYVQASNRSLLHRLGECDSHDSPANLFSRLHRDRNVAST